MSLLHAQGTGFSRPVKAVFVPETGFVVAEINPSEYGYTHKAVRYQERIFYPKDELHITVVSGQSAETVRKHLEKQPQDTERIQEVVDQTDWSFRQLEEFYCVVDGEAETIIQMVEMPFLSQFYSDLSGITGSGHILLPTHVTLYMRGTETGIGLPNQTAFDTLVKARIRRIELHYEPAGQD